MNTPNQSYIDEARAIDAHNRQVLCDMMNFWSDNIIGETRVYITFASLGEEQDTLIVNFDHTETYALINTHMNSAKATLRELITLMLTNECSGLMRWVYSYNNLPDWAKAALNTCQPKEQ